MHYAKELDRRAVMKIATWNKRVWSFARGGISIVFTKWSSRRHLKSLKMQLRLLLYVND